jgi:hypothetical protein
MFSTQHQSALPTKTHSKHPRSLQIDLFSYKNTQKIPRLIRAKLEPKKRYYLELELFKEQMLGNGEDLFYQTYAVSSGKVRFYRAIFFALGVIFLGLALFSLNPNLRFFTVFFGNISLLAKGSLASFSLVLSFLALGIGYSLCIAKEASAYLTAKAKHKLMQLYARKRLEKGIKGLFIFFGKHYATHSNLKHDYHESLELLGQQQEKAVLLLQKIQKFASVDPSYRELLFNQALAEMNDELQGTLRSFEAEA